MKVSRGQTSGGRWRSERPIQTQQYKVKLWLKRLMPREHQQALEAVFRRLSQQAPAWPKLPKAARTRDGLLGVLGLFDAHFGKLCWSAETGHNYDLKIAEKVFANAVEDLLSEVQGRSIQQWLIPLGNDFYHLDNDRNTTFNGTPQDVDGRYAKIIEAGEIAVIRAIEKLLPIAPVQVVWVPGNHDPTTSYHLVRTVWAAFRRCRRIDVDYSPSPRKYFNWGSNLLGLTHGNEEKINDLPGIMATEQSGRWAASICREWLIGHGHRTRKWNTPAADTHQGVVIRMLQSIAGTDAWHHRKGYVGTRRAAELLLYGLRQGYRGHVVVDARGS